MQNKLMAMGAFVLACLLLSACEKVKVSDEESQEHGDGIELVFHVDKFEQVPFVKDVAVTRDAVPVEQLCTRLNFAVFSNGTKVKSIAQRAGDKDFGTVKVELSKGKTFQVVIIAHSGASSATITSPEKISFDGKVTDTFYAYQEITVDESKDYSVELKRAVAMFRLMVEDDTPSQIQKLQFKYTGGSSTFNAVTGHGCVNSKQTEERTVSQQSKTFEIYTFPHEDTDVLKITVNAMDPAGNILFTRTFEDVDVKRNMITQYSGKFYGEIVNPEANSFKFLADNYWEEKDMKY
ncbi:MAG: FimB/Mfa2 family fimbrial subunit [Prevotella sp.]|jgi:hypothetical protein|nr:FimB/Mfa2 family fimbrial subunit [Prevotella sp.]MCI2079825.1 FimB/Mfa2 family fimbrial subunit [Prevotella sp.]MCI2101981.1 FimB/Mfa2 family fimbrial subunit [Prevotella sp.]